MQLFFRKLKENGVIDISFTKFYGNIVSVSLQ